MDFWQLLVVSLILYGAWKFFRALTRGEGSASKAMAVFIFGLPFALGLWVILGTWGVFEEETCMGSVEANPKLRRVAQDGTVTYVRQYHIEEVSCGDPTSQGIRYDSVLADMAHARLQESNEALIAGAVVEARAAADREIVRGLDPKVGEAVLETLATVRAESD